VPREFAGLERVLCVWGLDKVLGGFEEAGVCGLSSCGDKTAVRMGHPATLNYNSDRQGSVPKGASYG
jgi:hypothetical protein